MALTKETVVDKIEVLENGTLQVRTATRVLEDGEVLSSSFHRHVIAPGDDTTGEPAETIAICNAVHTPAVIAAYEAMLAAQEAEMNAEA
ncbi:MAG: hypothetical protein HOF36_05390 [Candidatus Marinimicrobia bacterium]|nr:hypothetical protein [Candidatus Neomarinimicrobiota bacterium]